MDFQTGLRLWRIGNAVSCFGVVQFVVLTGLAMHYYPNDYSLFGDFLSDLGRTTCSGKPNAVSAMLFNGSLALLSVSLIPFFWFLPLHAADRARLLRIVSYFGFASCAALVGIAIWPYDTHPSEHMLALFYWLMLMLAISALHCIALLSSKQAFSILGLLSLGLFLMIAAFIIRGLAFGAAEETVVAQKCLVGYSLAWFIVFSYRAARSEDLELPFIDSELDEMANDYIDRVCGTVSRDKDVGR